MAKRVPPEEKPYRPVDDALVRSVLNPNVPAPEEEEGTSEESEAAQPPPPPPRVVNFPTRKAEPEPTEERVEPERVTREKRFLLTPSEDRQLDRLVADMAEQLGAPVKPSHVIRATVTLLCHVSEELVKQSRKVGPIKRPPNGDATALATFEHFLSRVIDTAIRNSKPLK